MYGEWRISEEIVDIGGMADSVEVSICGRGPYP